MHFLLFDMWLNLMSPEVRVIAPSSLLLMTPSPVLLNWGCPILFIFHQSYCYIWFLTCLTLAVWLLQAIKRLQICLCEPDQLDQDCKFILNQSRLWPVEQRSKCLVLRLPILQSRAVRQYQEWLEEGSCTQHHIPRLPHRRLLCWMLCLQKH